MGAAPFLSIKYGYLLVSILRSVVKNILLVGLDALVVLARANDNLVKLAQTSTGRNTVTADNVLLHAFQTVLLATNSGLVEYLGGLLERGGTHEALGT